MTNEILFKYISGQADAEEIQAVRKWTEESDKWSAELSRLKNIWVLSGLDNEIDPALKEAEITKILSKIRALNNVEKQKHRFGWLKYAAAIAALIILSGVGSVFVSKYKMQQSTEFAEIIVPNGERSTVILPDGSTVKLNCGSKLRFPSTFQATKREVFLTGEGFFDVKKDHKKPFVVSASDIKVEVLGTRFNVKCYSEDTIIETFLEEGMVKIKNAKNNKEEFLSPSEALQYDKSTGKYLKSKMKNDFMIDWTAGILTINNETIEELANKLERRYDIIVVFKDEEVKDHIYKGSIKDEDLKTVLEALKFASSLNYELNGKTVTISSINE